jgi:hypothetical protein
MPNSAPFSRAFTLRARNCSGVPPASCAAGVIHEAQIARVCALSSVPVSAAAPASFKKIGRVPSVRFGP